MICELVPATEDFRDEMGICFRALPYHKEGCVGTELFEEVEHFSGVRGRRTVVDRNPDLRLSCGEGLDHWSPPLTIGNECRVEEKEMRNEDGCEGDEEVCLDKRKRDEGRDEREAQKQAADPRWIILRNFGLHC